MLLFQITQLLLACLQLLLLGFKTHQLVDAFLDDGIRLEEIRLECLDLHLVGFLLFLVVSQDVRVRVNLSLQLLSLLCNLICVGSLGLSIQNFLRQIICLSLAVIAFLGDSVDLTLLRIHLIHKHKELLVLCLFSCLVRHSVLVDRLLKFRLQGLNFCPCSLQHAILLIRLLKRLLVVGLKAVALGDKRFVVVATFHQLLLHLRAVATLLIEARLCLVEDLPLLSNARLCFLFRTIDGILRLLYLEFLVFDLLLQSDVLLQVLISLLLARFQLRSYASKLLSGQVFVIQG